MKNLFLITLTSSLLTLTGCAPTISITHDYDKEVDFTAFKTFGYLAWSDASIKSINELDRKRIEREVKAELSSRGMTFVDGVGDVMVGFHLIIETKTGTTAYTSYYGGMGYGYGGWGYGGGMASTTYSEYEYQVGTLILDIFDVSTKQLAWESIANGEVSKSKNPDEAEAKLKRLIFRMFKDYPVKPVEGEEAK